MTPPTLSCRWRKGYSQLKDTLRLPVSASMECEYCVQGNFRRRFGASVTKRRKGGHLHVWKKGKIETESVKRHKYSFIIVQEASCHTTDIPVRSKGDSSEEFLIYVTRFESQTDQKVKSVHSRWGSEFNKAFKFLELLGVDTSRTMAYIHSTMY